MLHGVLRNKYVLTEDQLTSTVFGLIELSPRLLVEWLPHVRPWGAMCEPLAFAEDAPVELTFWPATRSHGEPDLLALIGARSGLDAVLIEAKHGAGKSQWNLPDDEGQVHRKHDQLVRYWHGLRERDFSTLDAARLAGARCTVVYLTPHAAAPRVELDQSCRIEPGIRLGWLSWRDLHAALDAVHARDDTEARVIAALRALLAHLGLTTFRGLCELGRRDPVDPSKTWRLDTGCFIGGARSTVRAEWTWSFGG